MASKELLIFLALCGIAVSSTVTELPSYLKRCKRNVSKEELNNCLRAAIEDAFPKLKKGDKLINIEAYDPIQIQKIIIKKSAGVISLDVNQKDAEVYGFGDGIRISKIDFNFEKKIFSATLLVPKLVLTSFQTLKGKILGIPLTWRGKMSGNITKVKCVFSAPFKHIQKDNREHLKFYEDKIKLTLDLGNVRVHHKESSPNDKILAMTADKIINDNWKLVFGVLKPSYEDVFRKELGKSLNGLFSTIPLDGIFLP